MSQSENLFKSTLDGVDLGIDFWLFRFRLKPIDISKREWKPLGRLNQSGWPLFAVRNTSSTESRFLSFFSCSAAMLQQVVAAWVARKIRDRLFEGRHLHLFPWNSSLASNTWNLALSLDNKKKRLRRILERKRKTSCYLKCGGRFFYMSRKIFPTRHQFK